MEIRPMDTVKQSTLQTESFAGKTTTESAFKNATGQSKNGETTTLRVEAVLFDGRHIICAPVSVFPEGRCFCYQDALKA